MSVDKSVMPSAMPHMRSREIRKIAVHDTFKRGLKALKLDRAYYYLRDVMYINKVAIAVEKELTSLMPLGDALERHGVQFAEISADRLAQNAPEQPALTYAAQSRRQNALRCLEKGYRGIALVRGREIVGDIWYVTARNNERTVKHPDLSWLGIRCEKKDVYAFDMYVHPDKRGHNLATILQNGALHEIRKQGYGKVYGYYWAAYVPALWVHRTLKWRELGRIKVSRFFSLCLHMDAGNKKYFICRRK